MATIVNNPGNSDSSSGVGFVIGIVLLIVALGVFFVYGLPALRGNTQPSGTNINVEVPSVPNPTSDASGGGTNTP